MLEWFKSLSRNRSRKNIAQLVSELVEIANQADATIQRFGRAFPQEEKAIRKLQDRLLLQLCGPLPLKLVRLELIDPVLAGTHVTDLARMAVEHVYKTVYDQVGDRV